jgi:Tfp pilus assembly protein PilV
VEEIVKQRHVNPGPSDGRTTHGGWRARRDAASPDAVTDRGSSLIEVVMALVIMAVIVVPFGTAVWSTISASARSTDGSAAQTILTNAADRINRAATGCDYASYAQAAATANNWPANTISTSVQRYVPGATPLVAGTWAAGGCVGATPAAVQLVTVTLTMRPGSTSGTVTIQVVKSAL